MAAVAILSPHLDDAVLSCWHVLASSEDVRVVNVFTGEPPAGVVGWWDRLTGAVDPAARVRERLEEDERALALAGRSAEQLGFLDGQHRDGPPGDVLGALRELPEEVFYAPAGIAGHPDHEALRDAALELDADVGLYADRPYTTEFGWPAWMTGAEDDPFRDVDAFWSQFLPEGFEPHPVELDEQQQQAKAEAMRAYRSQFPMLEGGPQRRLSHPELLRFELVWRRS